MGLITARGRMPQPQRPAYGAADHRHFQGETMSGFLSLPPPHPSRPQEQAEPYASFEWFKSGYQVKCLSDNDSSISFWSRPSQAPFPD